MWDITAGRCLGILSGAGGGTGHSNAVSCLAYIPAVQQGSEAYIASGSLDCEVKLWKTNGEFVHSCSHPSSVTSMCYFQDTHGGVPMLLIGHENGSISARSCLTMKLLFFVEAVVCKTRNIRRIMDVGKSCFATTGDDGNVIVWSIGTAVQEPN